MVKKRNPVKLILIIFSVLVLAGIIVFTVGKSFAFFNYKKEGEVVNVVTFNGLSVNIKNSSSEALNLTNAYPEYDFDGMNRNPIEFTITNHSKKPIDYKLKVENDQDKQNNCILNGSVCPQLSTNYIRYSYKLGNSEWSEPANLGSNNNIVLTSTILKNGTSNVEIKIWIDSTSPNEIQGKYFYGKLILEATKSTNEIVTVFDFDYTGGEQTFTPTLNGTYKLEVWGAQGGDYYSENGNFGGYSTGVVNLTSSTKLYINVGGQGSYVLGDRVDDPWGATNNNIEYVSGGYNGGGDGSINSNDQFANSGGGASHIALVSGELKNLSSYKDTAGTNISNEIIIVAGGGGACHGWTSGAQWFGTLSGGGFKTNQGTAGNIGISEGRQAPGATQTTGYAFGQGQSGRAGAGGGWYGGYSSTEQIATGGTGYIANPNLTDKAMYCIGCEESSDPSTLTITTEGSNQNLDKINCPDGYKETPTSKCAKAGNGHVRITYLGN